MQARARAEELEELATTYLLACLLTYLLTCFLTYIQARARAEELRELATNAVALELGLSESSAEAALLATAGAAEGEEGEEGEEAEAGGRRDAPSFSEDELLWGRKEAKSKLSAEDFKRWRKAVKKAK